MLYRPFADHLDEVAPEDLSRLTDVHEGWYVEYKREMIGNRELAKSLSSFANQYGGWLFLGVEQDSINNVAAGFPGIADTGIQGVLDSIRNAAKDLLNPPVFYNVRIFAGPIAQIQLPAGRSILVVQIPEGPNSPYIHNDGRIYRRVGDSSQPMPVTDRATFDLLAQKGQEAQARLSDKVLWSPATSRGEENQPFLHISVLTDPFEVMGHWYDGSFSDFADTMSGDRLPFNNIFSSAEGFVARQTGTANTYNRLFTWHFSRNCHSFVTVPIPLLHISEAELAWSFYSIGKEFWSRVVLQDLAAARILDLNFLMNLVGGISMRHRTLVGRSNITGPLYMKARLENVWRTIPFVENSKYLEYLAEYGIPLVQDYDIVIPDGTSIESFVVSPDLGQTPSEEESVSYEGPILLSMMILDALGIPMEILKKGVSELHQMAARKLEFDRIKQHHYG